MKQNTGTFSSIDEARSFFRNDRYATESGMQIDEMGEGWSVCSFVIDEHHQNAQGGVMGGAIFTLMDFAYAVAASTIHRPTVMMQSSVSYLNAPKGKKLTARADCMKDGRTSCVYHVSTTDDTGRTIAQAIMTGFKLSD